MSNPSLILPQSPAYGEDYVYAAQVEDGAVPLYNVLPLTFTRASGGTRINKDGLVQNMPYNLVEQSETFDNGVWIKYAATSVIANTTTAPNGTTTADTISTSGIDVIRQFVTLVANSVNTYTIYVKKISYDYFGFQNLVNGTGAKSVFNLSNGTVTTQASGHTASIESVGNGWYRCIVTFNCGSSSSNIFDLSADGTSATLRTFYAWGAQTNIGSTAQPYLATTDRLNMPRITYPVGGGCGALLLEKQSTNVLTYSEQFDNADWTKANGSVTANATISPDGTQNADKYIPNTSSTDDHILRQTKTVTNGSAYTFSVYAKNGGYNFITLVGANGSTVQVNLTSGGKTEYGSPTSTNVENIGNGWFRIAITATANSTSYGVTMNIQNSGSTQYPIYSGNGTDGVFVYGAQMEASSYATSYIPTTSTSATRIADACYKTGISNLIGQTEGTMFGELLLINGETCILSWTRKAATGLYSDMILVYFSNISKAEASVRVGNTEQVLITSSSSFSEGYHKIAFAYKQNDFVLYVDGVQVGSDTIGSVPTCDELYIDNYIDGGARNATKKEFVLYKTRLTNAELQALTS